VARRTAQLAEMNERLADDIRQRELADTELRERNLALTELNNKLRWPSKAAAVGKARLHRPAGGRRGARDQQPHRLRVFQFRHPEGYLADLFSMLDAYQEAEPGIAVPEVAQRLRALREQIDLAYLRTDIPC
jgi:hypothetical protein